MKQRGRERMGFAVWVGFVAAASGCGGWVDLRTSEDSGAGGADEGSGATGAMGATGPGSGTSSGGGASTASGGASTTSGGASTGTAAAGAGGSDAEAGASGEGPFQVLPVPAPTLIPEGAEGPGITWTAAVSVTAGRLAHGTLAGTTAYCFKKPFSQYSCDWQSEEPFVWTEQDGLVPLDVEGLDGTSYYPSRVSRQGTTVVGAFRKANDDFGLFRWTKESGVISLGAPAGSAGYELVSADGQVIAGMFKTNDKTGHLNFTWTEADGFQPLDEASGWPADSEVRAISADGSVLVGATVGVEPGQVFRYAQGVAAQLGSLPDFPGCDLGYVNSLSADGKVVYGACRSADQQSTRAFRWTEATGLAALSDTACQMKSVVAWGTSGEPAFGMGACNGVPLLARWTQAGGVTGLPPAPAGFKFESVTGTDEAGNTVFGALVPVSAEPTEPPPPGALPQVPSPQGFRWRAGEGLVRLPLASGQSFSVANAIDPSGRVLVGRAGQGDQDAKAVLWDATGPLELETYLESQGVDLRGVELNEANDVVVRDGTIHVLGSVQRGAWLARIPLVR